MSDFVTVLERDLIADLDGDLLLREGAIILNDLVIGGRSSGRRESEEADGKKTSEHTLQFLLKVDLSRQNRNFDGLVGACEQFEKRLQIVNFLRGKVKRNDFRV